MKFRKKTNEVEAVQWNVPGRDGKPKLAKECKDHPAVRGTSRVEVFMLLGTSGCSKEEPHWDWSVMGVIQTISGPHTISPGDWVITEPDGVNFYLCRRDVFEATYEPIRKGGR